MVYRVNTGLKKDLEKFGLKEWNECYHCGNCTAVCSLTRDDQLFPRRSIRYLQMGLKEKISTNVDPWLCYYCGDCTETCPRDANPGEVMMAMRRYLTSLYDWTGLSRKFYTSKVWEVGAIAFFALLVIAIFAFLAPAPEMTLTAQGGVKINSFAPIQWVHLGDWIMAGLIGGLLITNIFNMYYKVILKDRSVRIPFYLYFKEFYNIIFHFASQWKLSKCDDKKYWGLHWLIMSGYTIMFILVVGMLPFFQTEAIHPFYHPQRLLGYYATIGLLIGLAYILVGRIRRKEIKFRFSHLSDWLFIVMLIFTVISGILVHWFRLEGWVMATYYMYIAHLAILVPMLMIEVPFSKWSHLAYRPFAIYFSNLKTAARKLEASGVATVKKTDLATA
jgi:heterodisulfide reductase subunit C